MKRLLPRSQAALRQRPRLPAATTATTTTSATSFTTPSSIVRPLSSTSRRHAPPPSSTNPETVQVHPRGAYYDILLTNPPPYSNVGANRPPVTANPEVEETAPKKEDKVEEKATPKPPSPNATNPKQTSKTPSSKSSSSSSSSSSNSSSKSFSTMSSLSASISSTPVPLAGGWRQQEAPATIAARKAAEQQTVQERAALVFGSRLAGPMERANRLAEIRKRSTKIAGVLVPPKPNEPDNCCMSGCVNCVWDRFRDEMEEWAAASAEASRRLQAQEGGVAATTGSGSGQPSVGAPPPSGHMSMDDDGGGSDTNWSFEEAAKAAAGSGKKNWDEELYKGVPVGIREFMKQEKRLKLKHMNDGQIVG